MPTPKPSPRVHRSIIAKKKQSPRPSPYAPEFITPAKPAAPSGPSLYQPTRKEWFPTLRSKIRHHFAALPSPVQRTFRVLRVLAPALPIGVFLGDKVMQLMWVRGPSMTPYLNESWDESHVKRDLVLVNMWRWGWFSEQRRRRLKRGMVVTFRSPANPSHISIKRIIGLPGDRITTRHPCKSPSQIVPWNHVWVEGDAEDPGSSLDSNTYGPVSIGLISGRVVAVLGPRARWLNWEDWEADEAGPDDKPGGKYRQAVRDRVLKEAVELERFEPDRP